MSNSVKRLRSNPFKHYAVASVIENVAHSGIGSSTFSSALVYYSHILPTNLVTRLPRSFLSQRLSISVTSDTTCASRSATALADELINTASRCGHVNLTAAAAAAAAARPFSFLRPPLSPFGTGSTSMYWSSRPSFACGRKMQHTMMTTGPVTLQNIDNCCQASPAKEFK